MPNLRSVIDAINTALSAGPLSTAKFQDARINNLAYLVAQDVPNGQGEDTSSERIVRPCIVADDGECTDLTLDDTVGLQLYHRNVGLAYEDRPEEDFGEPGNSTTEIADMVMIVIGDRNRIKVVQEDMAAALWGAMPRTLSSTVLGPLNLQSVDIAPGETNVNSESVWGEEFEGTDYALMPEDFMIAIRYRITTLYSKNCFTLCP